MNTCTACGFPTPRPFCYFCQRTVELIRARLCVSCTAPVSQMDNLRIEGKCSPCLSRHEPVSSGTRWLLRQAAKARYAMSRSPSPKSARKIAA